METPVFITFGYYTSQFFNATSGPTTKPTYVGAIVGGAVSLGVAITLDAYRKHYINRIRKINNLQIQKRWKKINTYYYE